MRGAAVSDLILPSFEDEFDYFNDQDPFATIVRYQNVGAQTVIVKNGEAPVVYSKNGKTNEIPGRV